MRINRPKAFFVTLAGRGGSLNLFIFSAGTGGRLGERLMKRLGMPVSDDTILRQLKKHVAAQGPPMSVRVAGVDDWSWRKGFTYGTIVVDLERREVVDVLPDHSAAGTGEWFSCLVPRCAGNGFTLKRSGSFVHILQMCS